MTNSLVAPEESHSSDSSSTSQARSAVVSETIAVRQSEHSVILTDPSAAASSDVHSVVIVNDHDSQVEVIPVASTATSHTMLEVLPNIASSSSQENQLDNLRFRLQAYITSPDNFSLAERADLCRIFAQAV